ncbi:MAG: zinc ribbon domain-containing protein [Planctomycetota bacterium]|nr:MAG: zinc ribbon domain-containing protein [Planctomycetota bacterium]
MPHYDYRCDACEHEFEVFQQMSEEPLQRCPACGRRRLRRLLGTGGGLLFRGSGFYQTDYKQSSPPCPSGGDCPAAKPAAGGG